METKIAYAKQTLAVLLIAIALIALCTGGLWLYVRQADAETGVEETAEASLPKESTIAITKEKYDNYPSDVDEGDFVVTYQGFGLTAAEKERLENLREEYKAGMRPSVKAPAMPAETGFAILPLDPGNYAGMTEYYFLPAKRLTDEQILQLIDYGEEKGEPFTADTLSTKNCMRGGAVETNRFYSAGESARRDILFRRITEEGLRPQTQDTGEITLPLATVADIPMNEEANYGLDTFHFSPIREMTDEEIIKELMIGTDPDYYLNPLTDTGINPTADAAKARAILEDVLGMPLCAEEDTFQYTREEGTGLKFFQATYNTPKINGREGTYFIKMDIESGQCHTLLSNVMDDSLYYYSWDGTLEYGPSGGGSQIKVDLNDERCQTSAREALEKISGQKVLKVEPMMETNIGGTYDQGMLVSVQTEDGKVYQVGVGYADAVVMSIDYQPDWNSVEDWRKTWQP